MFEIIAEQDLSTQSKSNSPAQHLTTDIYFTKLFHSRVRNSVVEQPWTSLLDIHRSDPWHAPVAATTVFSTPDDARRKRPKHVEWICSC